jgi:type IV secretory pathway VirB2 component (pilin)
MVAGYVIIMTALATGLWLALRRPLPRPGAAPPGAGQPGAGQPSAAGWRRLARHVAGTVLGGYLLLMAVVIVYYYGVARVAGAFIKSAFTGCALLIALALPVFAAASWLAERRRAGAGLPRPRVRPRRQA